MKKQIKVALAVSCGAVLGLTWWAASSGDGQPGPVLPTGNGATAPGGSQPIELATAQEGTGPGDRVVHREDLVRRVLGAELPPQRSDADADATAGEPRTRPGGASLDQSTAATRKDRRGTRLASADPHRGLREKVKDAPSTAVAVVGSSVRVTGPDHTAEFDARGLEFMPHDRRGIGVASSRLAYRLDAVARGENVLWSGGDCAPVVSGNQVRYERAPGLVEHYLALDRGVEQMFSLAEIPPGSGDLVFRAQIDTGLEGAGTEAGGLHFRGDGEPGVVFGRAVAYDGLGRSTSAELALAGNVLELRVPGDWLDRAQGPLLVDPLIGSDINLTFFAATRSGSISPTTA